MQYGTLKGTLAAKKTLQGSIVAEKTLQGSMTKPAIVKQSIQIDDTLKFNEQGALGVRTATAVEKDNTLPITSAAVETTVGNIEILLKTI